tara:strand:- start:2161 stop:4074 length:1914 start_codon:yes stop_codon:yes gene_type:complete
LLASLTIFGPLIGFILSFFLGKNLNNKFSQYTTSIILIISSICAWIIFFDILINNISYKISLFNWIQSGNLNVDWSIKIDALTSVMFIVVTTVSATVHIYSIGYMAKDNSIPRFMGYLSLFTFFMLVLVCSDNLLQMFFGWEGVGLCSYLLIGFWYNKSSANLAAIKAFIVNRIGDFAFLIGIVGIFFIFNTIDLDEIFLNVEYFRDHKINIFGLNISSLNFLCILLFIGAMGKSAQIGLHTWLPDAMEGPTPVSALIHAATMVTAGIFMIARMSPVFYYAEFANMMVTFVGAVTAIFAATIALTQNDIKKVIAYSTCSQLGYMFFAAGLGAYSASIFHLMTHGFFKALLFLCAGSVIHALNDEQDMRKMGGLAKKIPFTTSLMWIGSLAIIGFPFFSGYYSKESILHTAYFSNSYFGNFAYLAGLVTAGLTAFYSWRLLIMTFHGKNNSRKDIYDRVHESPLIMIIPLIILAFGSIFSGLLLSNYFIGNNSENFWNNSIIMISDYKHHIPYFQSFLIKLITAIGIIFATIFYFYYTNIPKILSNKFNKLYKLSLNKWYFDELYNFIFVNSSFKIANIFWKKGDQNTIDYYGPDGISKLVKIFSNKTSKIQTGYLFHYAFIMLIGLVVLLTWYLFIY